MEIKINKEIRAYRETLFFGLSVRQFICSVLAVGVAVGLYFSLSRVLDRETVSWVCIVGAARGQRVHRLLAAPDAGESL